MSLDGVQLAALRTSHQAPPADLLMTLNRIQTAYVSHTQPGKPPLSWLVFLAGILSSPNRPAPILPLASCDTCARSYWEPFCCF